VRSLAAALPFSPSPQLRIARRFKHDHPRRNPFKTIGIVATIIVFGSAMLLEEGWALLGILEPSALAL
jgi:hypothetical protein